MDDEPAPGSNAAGARSTHSQAGPSLRLRVVLVLLAINLVVFTAGGLWLSSTFREAITAKDQALLAEVDTSVRDMVNKGGDLNVRRILQDRVWQRVDDVMIVDKAVERVAGRVVHRGVALNPRGVGDGSADRGALLEVLAQVLESGDPVPFEDGTALRIEDRGGIWGAFWYRLPPDLGSTKSSALQLFPWFLISTALLTAGSYFLLRSLVLRPVGALAAGVASLEAGDHGARVADDSGSGELSQLVRGFNAMADEVQGFSARLEAEVRRATDQARAAEKAALTQRQLAAMGEFTAGIAHEINNPLGGLLNATDVLGREDLAPEKRQRYLELLADGLERIQLTVGQLLRFTPRETEATQVDLVDVVRDGLALVRHRSRGLGVELRLTVDGQLLDLDDRDASASPCLTWARNELGQAFLNLFGNALDALEEAGTREPRIAVELECSRGLGPRAIVRDNGPGVAAEHLDRVTDLFFTTKEVGKGSGLGLAIVHRIVDAHGGQLELSSAPGQGFTAKVQLPPVPSLGAPGVHRGGR
ncbi:MAG: HAMP domain-containing sensor histidine kinase [Planctomycetota bacterium]|nr:HAMP domain-containing sensor histidine kinase [Planctomycetota bacterium]